MSSSRWERFAPLTGVVFFVLLAITLALSNDTPDTDSSTADTVSYWSAHDSRLIASAILGTFAVIFFIWFGGKPPKRADASRGRRRAPVHARIRRNAHDRHHRSDRQCPQFTAADTVNDVPATVTQTLSVLNEDFFFPFLAGIAVFMFATGICVLRHGGLPRWLAWAAIVIGVVTVTPLDSSDSSVRSSGRSS